MSDEITDQLDMPTALQTAGTVKDEIIIWMHSARPELLGRRLALLCSQHPNPNVRRDAALLAGAADADVLRIVRASYQASGELLSTVSVEGENIDQALLRVAELEREDVVAVIHERGAALREASMTWPLIGELSDAHQALREAEQAATRLQARGGLTPGQAQMVGALTQRLERGDADAVQTLMAMYGLLLDASDLDAS